MSNYLGASPKSKKGKSFMYRYIRCLGVTFAKTFCTFQRPLSFSDPVNTPLTSDNHEVIDLQPS